MLSKVESEGSDGEINKNLINVVHYAAIACFDEHSKRLLMKDVVMRWLAALQETLRWINNQYSIISPASLRLSHAHRL